MLKICSALWVTLLIGFSWSAMAQSPQNLQPQVKETQVGESDSPEPIVPPIKFPISQEITDAIANAIERASDKHEQDHPPIPPDNSAWWFNFLLAAFTGLLVVVGGLQCFLIFHTLKATQNAAKAALLALDRPWLYLEITDNSTLKLYPDKVRPIARFRIVNHGKAPALILWAKAALFYSPGPFNNDAFKKGPGRGSLPNTMREFPAANQVRQFLNMNGQEPLEEGTKPAEKMQKILFNNGIVIPSGGNTKEYVFQGTSVIDVSNKSAIQIEYTVNLYLVGSIGYQMPTGETEVLSFCYEARSSGQFRAIYGPPYNERKKQET